MDPLSRVLRLEQRQLVIDAILQLDPIHREALLLMTHERVGPDCTKKSRLHRAKLRVREALGVE